MSGGTYDGYLHNPEVETLPRDKLRELQLEKLQKTAFHAYANVPRYKAAWDAVGALPGDLKSLSDLAKFPFTVKDDLRACYPFGMFAVPRDQVARVHASSGTTGRPTVVGYAKEDLNAWAEIMARTLSCAGARPGDIVHNAFGYGLFTGGLGVHYGAERLGCTVVPVSGGMSERQILLLRDFGARVLCATPSYALSLAEAADRAGVDLRKLPVAVGFFGAEPWSEGLRAALDERWGFKAVDNYGLSEIIGPGVACECVEARDGLHGWEDLFLFEIIDPDTGEVRGMEEEGELVITTLAKWAQPMIRYRTRDITRLTDAPCLCGRTHVRLKRVTGRSDDMLIIRGVNVYPSQVESVLMGLPGTAPHYQLVITRDGALDNLTVAVEAAANSSVGDFDEISGNIRRKLKETIGITCRAVVLAPGEIPRSEGKAVRVRDDRK